MSKHADLEQTVGFCGAEMEAASSFLKEEGWIDSGGRVYTDGSCAEINTPLIPINESVDAAELLYKAVLADRARLLKLARRKRLPMASIHLNFTYPDNYALSEVMGVLGPALSLVAGRASHKVGLVKKSRRLEVCCGHLSTKGSIVTAAAIGIAATAALRCGEISPRDFEFIYSGEIFGQDGSRRFLDAFGDDETSWDGRDQEVATQKGNVCLDDVLQSTIKILEPYIKKYCSPKTYNFVKRVVEGKELLDIDVDLYEDDDRIQNSFTVSETALAKETGKSLPGIIAASHPIGPAKLFAKHAKAKKGDLYEVADVSWSHVDVAIGYDSYQIDLPYVETFLRAAGLFRRSKSALRSVSPFLCRGTPTQETLSALYQKDMSKNNMRTDVLEFLLENKLAVCDADRVSISSKGKTIIDTIDPVINILPFHVDPQYAAFFKAGFFDNLTGRRTEAERVFVDRLIARKQDVRKVLVSSIEGDTLVGRTSSLLNLLGRQEVFTKDEVVCFKKELFPILASQVSSKYIESLLSDSCVFGSLKDLLGSVSDASVRAEIVKSLDAQIKKHRGKIFRGATSKFSSGTDPILRYIDIAARTGVPELLNLANDIGLKIMRSRLRSGGVLEELLDISAQLVGGNRSIPSFCSNLLTPYTRKLVVKDIVSRDMFFSGANFMKRYDYMRQAKILSLTDDEMFDAYIASFKGGFDQSIMTLIGNSSPLSYLQNNSPVAYARLLTAVVDDHLDEARAFLQKETYSSFGEVTSFYDQMKNFFVTEKSSAVLKEELLAGLRRLKVDPGDYARSRSPELSISILENHYSCLIDIFGEGCAKEVSAALTPVVTPIIKKLLLNTGLPFGQEVTLIERLSKAMGVELCSPEEIEAAKIERDKIPVPQKKEYDGLFSGPYAKISSKCLDMLYNFESKPSSKYIYNDYSFDGH